MNPSQLIGGAWLVAHYGLKLVMPLSMLSRIGGRRSTQVVDGVTTETFVEAMRPDANLRGHVTFHLKHEVPHLELLARLFAMVDPKELANWVQDEPSGQYAKRAGFLFEWFTGRELPLDVEVAGGYVDVIDPQKLVVASPNRAVPNRRWRVRDNLPGTPAFCPMVRLSPEAQQAMALDVPGLLHELASEFG